MAGAHLSRRLTHGVRDFPGPERLPLPLGHGAHHGGLVRDFMIHLVVLADLAARFGPQ